jgi:hypothetical protein
MAVPKIIYQQKTLKALNDADLESEVNAFFITNADLIVEVVKVEQDYSYEKDAFDNSITLKTCRILYEADAEKLLTQPTQ